VSERSQLLPDGLHDHEAGDVALADQHGHGLGLVELGHDGLELLDIRHLDVVDAQDDVALADPGARGSAFHAFDPDAVLDLELALLHLGQIRYGDADTADGRRLGVVTLGGLAGDDALGLELGDDDAEIAAAAAPINLKRRLGSRLDAADDSRQLNRRLHRAAVDLGDHVAGLDARLLGRAAGLDRLHERTHRLAE